MDTFYGTTLCKGTAIASTATLEGPAGMQSFAAERLARIADKIRRHFGDPIEEEEAVLAGTSATAGLLTSIPYGLTIIGLAMAEEMPGIEIVSCPAVAGLGREFLACIAEGEIIIVDGDHGVVIVDPDAITIARYQEPMRKRPYHLAAIHQRARTRSGKRDVEVYVRAASRNAAAEAISAGADGIVIGPDNDFLGGDEPQTAAEQLQVLQDLFERTSAMPVILDVPAEALSLQALYEASATGPLTVAVRDLDLLASLRAQAAMIEDSLDQAGVTFGEPRFEAILAGEAPDADDTVLDGFAGLWFDAAFWDLDLTACMPCIAHARHQGLPVLVSLEGDLWPDFLPTALALGCERIIVTPDIVGVVKDYIRQL